MELTIELETMPDEILVNGETYRRVDDSIFQDWADDALKRYRTYQYIVSQAKATPGLIRWMLQDESFPDEWC